MKLFYIITLTFFSMQSAFAAYNDVSIDTNTVFSVNSIQINVSNASSVVQSATVNTGTLVFSFASSSLVTITAPGRNQMSVSVDAGVSSSVTCDDSSSSISFTATGSGNATVTPSSTLCATLPSPGSTSSGGYFMAQTSPSSSLGGTYASSTQIQASSTNSTPSGVSNVVAYFFKRNIDVGAKGEDVKELQKFLNRNGFAVAAKGVGSKGNETTLFGAATKNALIAFQNKYKAQVLTPGGLKKGTGYFGSATRNFVNDHPELFVWR
jgi:hypothetical protein